MRYKDTDKKKKILDFVNRQVMEKGYPPSVREFARLSALNPLQPFTHIYPASREGLISKDPTKPGL